MQRHRLWSASRPRWWSVQRHVLLFQPSMTRRLHSESSHSNRSFNEDFRWIPIHSRVVQTAVHSVMMFTTSQKMQIFIWMFRTLWTHPAGSKELSDPPAGTVNVFQSLLGHCNLGYHQTHIRSAWLTPHSTKATAFVSSLESTDGKLQMIRRQISNNKDFSSSVLRHRGQRLANTSLKETTTLNFQRLLTNAAWRPDNKGTLRLKTSAGLQTWFHQ